MNIIEALKSENGIRVSYSLRWLCWDQVMEQWEVRESKYGGHGAKLVIETRSESLAVQKLLED